MGRICLVPGRLDLSLDENMRAKEGGKETTDETSLRLPFITSHSRFALASIMRKTKRLRWRLGQNPTTGNSLNIAVSPCIYGLYFSKALFKGLTFGGAYLRTEICVSKSIGLVL